MKKPLNPLASMLSLEILKEPKDPHDASALPLSFHPERNAEVDGNFNCSQEAHP